MTKFKFLIPLILLSCSKPAEEKPPSNVLPEDKLVEILTDIRLAEANVKVARQMQQYDPKQLDSSYAVIFHKYDVSSEQVDSSFSYYSVRPEIMQRINEKILERLNMLN